MIAKLCEVNVNLKKPAKNLSKIIILTPKDTRPTFCGLDKPSQERQKAGYVVHNIYFGKSFGKFAGFENFELNFAVENIFDKKYRVALSWEDRDYPVSITNPLLNAGRNFKAGFKASF